MGKIIVCICLTSLLLASCAGSPRNVDYDPAADFAHYQTYAWSENTDEHTSRSRISTPLVHQRVRESIESALAVKGFQKVDAAQADVLVAYHLSVAAVGQTGGGLSVGVGRYSGRSSVGVSVGVPIGGRMVEEGTLVIDLIDARKNTMVWQGFASQRLPDSPPSPEQASEKIKQAVNEIFANYPPDKR